MYYWQIVTYDSHGEFTNGPIWAFTTQDSPIEWDVTLDIVEIGGKYNNVIFGEASNANSGSPYDDFDLPSPPSLPPPNILAYFNDNLEEPYYHLKYDYRHYNIDNTCNVWNLTIIWENVSAGGGTNIHISWDNNEFSDCEYDSIILWDSDDEILCAEMKTDNEYYFYCESEFENNFKIIATTIDNPPNIPCNPNPSNGSINISTDANLSWTGGDINPTDVVTYDIYFGDVNPPPMIAANYTDETYDLNTLDYETTYYWKIVAWDNHHSFSEGSTWTFITEIDNNLPPDANYTYSPLDPTTGDIIQFTDISTDDGTIISWIWDFGNGDNSTEQNPTYQYLDPDTYTVNLTVTDDKGVNDSIEKDIIVTVVESPLADFTWIPINPNEGETITFADQSTNGSGTITNWYWEFGDGETSELRNPTHSYPNAGSYSVILTVINSYNLEDSIEKTIRMLTKINTNLIPTDDADADSNEPETNFGSNPYLHVESNITSGPRISYIKFNISEIPNGVTITNASYNTYVYNRSFLNNLYLGIVGNSWDEDILTWNNKPGYNTDLGFVNVSSTDKWYSWNITSEVQSALSNTEISFSMVLEEGNGSIFMNSKEMGFNAPILKIEYIGETSYNIPPTANSGGPYSGYINEVVSFDGSASIDTDGTVNAYRWDYDNDGTYDTGWSSSSAGSFTYTSLGKYTIMLQIRDNFGAKDTDNTTVEIINKDSGNGGNNGGGGGGGNTGGGDGTTSVPTNIPPIANASLGEPYIGFVGEEIIFDGSLSNDTDGNITSWEWDFGDGTNGTGEIVTHIYLEIGTFTVVLTVTDEDGDTNSYETIAVISQPNIPPTTPTITGPTQGNKNTKYNYTFLSTNNDNDTIKYSVDWGDGKINETDFMLNGTVFEITHSWVLAGKYKVIITADDNESVSSVEFIVMIDSIDVKDIGYLTDDNGDGLYDMFHNGDIDTPVGIIDGTIVIDIDGDGKWDYYFDFSEGLTDYKEKVNDKVPVLEIIIGFIGVIIILFLMLYLIKKRRK